MRDNAVKLLRHSQDLCLNFEKIFDDLTKYCKEENILKKGNKSTKDFFEAKDGWYYSDYCFKADGFIKGFRMLIAVGDSESYPRYEIMCEKLKIEKQLPMILIYYAIKPVVKPEKLIENMLTIINDCSGFLSKEEIEEGYVWINFDDTKNTIAFNEEIIIENKPWDKKVETKNGYLQWNKYFTKAKIQIVNIFDISDRQKLEDLAKQIMEISLEVTTLEGAQII